MTRWDTNATIPERVISRLEQQWPNTMLMVNNYDRADTDTRLLLSPLLYSLSFGVLNSTATVTSTHQLEQFSRLPDLKDILLKTPNLKILDIRFKYNWMYRAVKWTGKSATPHLLNLPLNPRDRLPTLHELSFSGPPETYELDLRHCQLLKQCMDWSQLYRLDIGINCPQHFFEEIGSCLLNLKSLTMGVRTGERRYGHWTCGPLTCDDLGPVIRFIESVPDLHDLCITDLDAAVETLVPTILASQRSLQNFSYLASRHRRHQRQKIPHAWTPAQLLDLRQRCPNLSHLTIDFPLDNGKWVSHEPPKLPFNMLTPQLKPTNHATAIPHFTHLQSLQIVVELNESASDFAAEYHQTTWGEVPTPPFNEQLGREVTTDLFKSIFENDPYAHLEDLQVVFTRTEVYDRGQSSDIEFPIKVRRLERDDAPSPGEGGFSVKCKGKWLGGWL